MNKLLKIRHYFIIFEVISIFSVIITLFASEPMFILVFLFVFSNIFFTGALLLGSYLVFAFSFSNWRTITIENSLATFMSFIINSYFIFYIKKYFLPLSRLSGGSEVFLSGYWEVIIIIELISVFVGILIISLIHITWIFDKLSLSIFLQKFRKIWKHSYWNKIIISCLFEAVFSLSVLLILHHFAILYWYKPHYLMLYGLPIMYIALILLFFSKRISKKLFNLQLLLGIPIFLISFLIILLIFKN